MNNLEQSGIRTPDAWCAGISKIKEVLVLKSIFYPKKPTKIRVEQFQVNDLLNQLTKLASIFDKLPVSPHTFFFISTSLNNHVQFTKHNQNTIPFHWFIITFLLLHFYYHKNYEISGYGSLELINRFSHAITILFDLIKTKIDNINTSNISKLCLLLIHWLLNHFSLRLQL